MSPAAREGRPSAAGRRGGRGGLRRAGGEGRGGFQEAGAVRPGGSQRQGGEGRGGQGEAPARKGRGPRWEDLRALWDIVLFVVAVVAALGMLGALVFMVAS